MKSYSPQDHEYNDYTLALTFQKARYQAIVYATLEGVKELYGAQVLRAFLGADDPDSEAIRALIAGEVPDEIQGLSEDEAVDEILGDPPEEVFETLLLELADDERNSRVLVRVSGVDDDGDDYEVPALTLRLNRQKITITEDLEEYLVDIRITQAQPTDDERIAEIKAGIEPDDEDEDEVDAELD
jgi:hypothetical protein